MARYLRGTRRFLRSTRLWAVALLAVVLTAGPALAIFPGGGTSGAGGGGGGTSGESGGGGGGGTGGGGGGGGGGGQVPEIGLGAAASALTLLAGVTLIALDRRRRAAPAAEPQA